MRKELDVAKESVQAIRDGVHAMVPRDEMAEAARHVRDTYAITPGIPLVKKEFGFYSLEAWAEQGMPQDVPLPELFDYDPPGKLHLAQLGWCEAAFQPEFEVKVLEDRGDYELAQDHAGRHVLFFKGRRSGFMPEYVDHPVKDRKTWEENIKPRLDPATPARWEGLEERMANAQAEAARGLMISQRVIGGYMYLRSMIGPADLFYAFYDMPDVIHDCMQAWLTLADAVIARHQEYVTLDELFLAEDICYNHGPLISPDMMREFLLPYYEQLIAGIKARQIDRTRHLYVQVDTDGFADPVIPIYQESIGMDAMSPFEVASGCDVVAIGERHPDLAIFGGIDKRVLAQGREAIDAFLERVIPPMRARGGYIPTSDHGVPAEVPYEDYLYYRKRCVELGS
jgi:uroporphyrinogen decarboxylase